MLLWTTFRWSLSLMFSTLNLAVKWSNSLLRDVYYFGKVYTWVIFINRLSLCFGELYKVRTVNIILNFIQLKPLFSTHNECVLFYYFFPLHAFSGILNDFPPNSYYYTFKLVYVETPETHWKSQGNLDELFNVMQAWKTQLFSWTNWSIWNIGGS